MDSRTTKNQMDLASAPAKHRGYLHLTECTRKQTEVKACREAWKTCPHNLWMDVLRALDVRTYRRLSRVSRDWRSNLAHVPRLNKGIFYLELANLSQVLRFEQFLPNGSQSFELVPGSGLRLPPATCHFPAPCSGTCHLGKWPRDRARAKDGKKALHIPDYEWWAQVFGITSLMSVKKVRYRTNSTLVWSSASQGLSRYRADAVQPYTVARST